ncbi:MAG: PadR family transcriptional regulator [Chloroflexi bacterium]|nr:PadR family transcriptional regulator [Chloroflexota bacterium]
MIEVVAQTKKFQKELNSGTSSLVLLSVLSRSKEAMYGYQIAKLLEESGPEIPMMKQGTLYPVLRSLEENGLLESMVEPSVSGPPRRYYKITADGRAALTEWLEIWKQTKKFVDAILKG